MSRTKLLSVIGKKKEFSGLYFVPENKSAEFHIVQVGNPNRTIKYSLDGKNWLLLYDSQNNISNSITVPANKKIYFKGTLTSQNSSNYIRFDSTTGNIQFRIGGNIYSILDEDNFENLTDLSNYSGYMFYQIFHLYIGGNIITSADDLKLPATKLCPNCYRELFRYSSVVSAKFELPATILADECYYSMFENCSRLKYPPTSLPATTLSYGCYRAMFNMCANAEYIPDLMATTLATNCYRYLTNGTTKVKSIKIGYTGNFSTTYFQNWVEGTDFYPNGVLYYNGSDTTHGNYAIPTGWTVQTF